MKQIKYFLIMAIAVMVSVSCSNDDDNQANGIVGEWIWIKSYGGFTGRDVQTPEQSEIRKIMKFHDNDTVEIYENEILVHKTDYFRSREESILLHDTFDFLTINYKYRITNTDSIIIFPMRYMIQELADTLMIDEDVYDGYGHLYNRTE